MSIWMTCRAALAAAVLMASATAWALPLEQPLTIQVEGSDLQAVIDEAPPGSTVVCDNRERVIEQDATIIIDKPLTLVGFRARLADDAANTEIVRVTAANVTIRDFELRGNRDTVHQDDRASLLVIGNDNFTVEHGRLSEATRHGIEVRASLKDEDLVNGVIRNIVTERTFRDGISINSDGKDFVHCRHILVENVVGIDSEARGAVEVVDGSRDVTVRNVFADGCLYGVEVHDHRRGVGESNQDIVIEGVRVTNSQQAVSVHGQDYDHRNITIRDVSGDNWADHPDFGHRRGRVDVSFADNVIVENVRVANNPREAAVTIRQARGVVARDIFVTNQTDLEAPAVEFVNTSAALADGILVRGDGGRPAGFWYRLDGRWGSHEDVQVRNVSAPDSKPAGIVFKRSGDTVALQRYAVTGNLARVLDQINGDGAAIFGNME